ncbi:Outer membrane protein assembly factor BamA [Bdellovibrio bacteriovorus]|uniref:outer membrane protein assembly factor n=1 Tax=Bdellovibrio bacteriovorus TaxID=959 RepID=UPI00045C007A|nr:outer membrane protein assembly factor [Bdellovibrio bacteriovorus]AHZ85004.1 surface antigen [Bdellovibrio bacteriovorus]BEV68891.1 Outer membrane protein assembly factor BamA [Bdellovibrio bacteriovorus]
MIRTPLLKPALILALSLGLPAWAVKKNLNYSPLPQELQQDLEKRFPDAKKERLSQDQVDEILRFMQQKPQLQRLRVFDDGNGSPWRMDFQLTRRISQVQWEGNKTISTSEAASLFGVKADDVFDQQTLIEGGEKLRQAYRDIGFYNAVIDIEMPPESPESVSILVRVNENKRTRVHNIVLQSPNEDLNKRLMKEIDGALNDPYTDSTLSKIQKDAREYLSQNRYIRADLVGPTADFNADESQVTLTYRLEKTEKYNFDYLGVRFLAIRGIENALDLDNYYSASPSVSAELAAKIRSYYLSKGYARAEVKADESELRNFQRKVTFHIDEGPQVKVQKYNLTGRYSKKDSYYINFIEEHSSAIVDSGYYNKDDIDAGLKNLILELQNNGYLQAKILSTRTQYNKERDAVTIYINLDEGPLTVVESVTFTGNQAFTPEELLKVTRLRPGPLKLGQIEEAVARLKNHYREQGYIEMLLLNERADLVTYDETNTKATLNFKIFEGPQVRVASIILEGNTFTTDYVIHKELEFDKGDLLTPSNLEESVARLQRTGFFGSVEIRTLEEKTNVANRTVLVKVTERDPGVFNFGVGATNERTLTLRGYTGIAYRNLWGTGRGISLRLEGNYNVADIKYLESRVVLGYLEPYIFNSRVRGRINVTRSSTVTDYDIKQVSDVRSTTYSLEKDFTSRILGIWDLWSLATIRDFGLDDSYPYDTLEQNIATTGPQLDLDFRDNPFNPTRGTFTRWNAEFSTPEIGSSPTIEYWRSTLSFTHYWTVGSLSKQPVVWANQVRGGYLKNLSKDGGVPWDKKGFTLGGQSTVRGYEAGTQEVFPNRQDLGLSDTDPTYYLTTDSTMYLIKSELRFPVWESLGGALFYDGGSVKIHDLHFTDPYRDSTGFGIRYNTPVGPLSLEWAWKLDARPGEEPWRFHLSIGTF